MKDPKGVYYYPFPQNKRVHMYVRESDCDVEFRLDNADDPTLWDDHGWVPYSALRQAAAIYTGKNFDPQRTYDLDLARRVLADAE